MGQRTNTAVWLEKYGRWQIKVQKDGKRKTFYSSIQGRNGLRECHKKADAWLDDGMENPGCKVCDLSSDFLAATRMRGGTSNYAKEESNMRLHIVPLIGNKKCSALCEQDLQDVIDYCNKHGLSKGTLRGIRATLSAFVKFTRKKRLTTLHTEDITIPKSARYKEKKILQPTALLILFNVDTTLFKGKKIVDPYINAYRYHVVIGHRPGEMVGMRYDDISGHTVTIKRSINQYKEETRGKNENALRRYVMPDMAYEAFQAQKKMYPPTSKHDSVWNIGREQTYSAYWRRYCAANNIDYVPLYRLRNTFVSLTKTLPEGLMKPFVGHSKDMDTFGVYGVGVKGEQEETAKIINEAFEFWLKSDKEKNMG